MKFKNTVIASDKLILANDHYVAIPYNCSEVTADDDGVIKAGTLIPSNDGEAVGVLLTDVVPKENPNGAVIIHGFIVSDKLPEAPSAEAATALTGMIRFM